MTQMRPLTRVSAHKQQSHHAGPCLRLIAARSEFKNRPGEDQANFLPESRQNRSPESRGVEAYLVLLTRGDVTTDFAMVAPLAFAKIGRQILRPIQALLTCLPEGNRRNHRHAANQLGSRLSIAKSQQVTAEN
jgi:hypothetical protein